jgi:hypothetical protein
MKIIQIIQMILETTMQKAYDHLGPKSHLSLLDQHNELKKSASTQKESEREKQLKEEEKILASVVKHKALLSFSELAKGVLYLEFLYSILI